MEQIIIGLDDTGGAPQIVGYEEVCGRILRRMGARSRVRYGQSGVDYHVTFPHVKPHGVPLSVRHHEPYPVEVGGKLGRKIKKGLKKVGKAVKKVAKDKVVRAVGKVGVNLLGAIPGIGNTLEKGIKGLNKAAEAAAKAIKTAKKGVKAVKVTGAAAQAIRQAAGIKLPKAAKPGSAAVKAVVKAAAKAAPQAAKAVVKAAAKAAPKAAKAAPAAGVLVTAKSGRKYRVVPA